MRRAGLLLALDQQLDGDRRGGGPGRRQAGPDAKGVQHDLPLVVGGAPGQQLAVPLGRLERRRIPLGERLDGLHIVVPVDAHRWCGGIGGRPAGEDRRQARRAGAARLPDLHLGEPGGTQVGGEPLGAGPHVLVVAGVGRNGGDGQPLLQVGDEITCVLLDVVTDVHDR